MSDQSSKIPWKRAELAVNKFVKTAETDVSRLRQFKKNILEYENAGDRPAVKKELSRAQQTISQLQSNLDSLQVIRKEIKEEDISKFDEKINKTRSWITEEIDAFTELDADYVEYLGEDFHQLFKSGLESPRTSVQYAQYGNQIQCEMEADSQESELQTELEMTEAQEQRIDELTRSAVHAKEIMTSLNSMVHEQGEAVDNIEDNVETTHTNVKKGGLSLNKAVALQTAGYTAVGAACGALVGGPIGFIIGVKIGLVTAGAGVAVGATVANKLKKKKQAANEVELQNLHAASDMAQTRILRQESVVERRTSSSSTSS